MNHALVVVEPGGTSDELLYEAGEFAAGVDASLVLLVLMTEETFESDMGTLTHIAEIEGTSYEQSRSEYVSTVAEDVAEPVLSDLPVDYEMVGRTEEESAWATRILEVAEDRECNHVFLRGTRRSPTGKALFGDTAQSVILNFDGTVTVSTY